jgi:hypothetical protein
MNLSDTVEINKSLLKLESENHFSDYRINVVGGCRTFIRSYIDILNNLGNMGNLSIKYYKDSDIFERDFEENPEKFVSKSVFNVYMFNLNYCRFKCDNDNKCFEDSSGTHVCKNPFECIECVCIEEVYEGLSVKDQITKDVSYINNSISLISEDSNKGSYLEIIVSDLDHYTIDELFKLVTGEVCPITSLKQMSSDISREDLINKLNNIIRINSLSFREQWEEAIQKLDKINSKHSESGV